MNYRKSTSSSTSQPYNLQGAGLLFPFFAKYMSVNTMATILETHAKVVKKNYTLSLRLSQVRARR